MTIQPCLAADRLHELPSLPPEHPMMQHVRQCPRCSAMLLEYNDFLAATDVPAGADLVAAEHRLKGAVAEILAPEADARTHPRATESLGKRLATWWAGPARAPALAFATLAVVAAGVWSVRSPAPDPDALRGGVHHPSLEWRAVAIGSEALALHWSSEPTATLYAVTILGPALETRFELPLTAGTSATLARSAWPAFATGETLFVRVEALRDGDVLSTSELEPIVLSR